MRQVSGETESPPLEEAAPPARQPRVPRWPWRKALVAGGILLLIAHAAFWLRKEAEPRERDYHAIRREFERIEGKIREGDIGLWLVVEGEPHDEGAGAAAREERHRRILEDFEILGRAQNFVMSDVDIEVGDDRALLRYTLQGRLRPSGGLPRGGRMEFVRKQGLWVLDDHHFVDH